LEICAAAFRAGRIAARRGVPLHTMLRIVAFSAPIET
jgi:hypothetical protein